MDSANADTNAPTEDLPPPEQPPSPPPDPTWTKVSEAIAELKAQRDHAERWQRNFLRDLIEIARELLCDLNQDAVLTAIRTLRSECNDKSEEIDRLSYLLSEARHPTPA